MSTIKKNSDYKLKAKNRRTKKPYEKKANKMEQIREEFGHTFLIKWKNYGEKANSWEHEDDISQDLIDDFDHHNTIKWYRSCPKHDHEWDEANDDLSGTLEKMYQAAKNDQKDYYLTINFKNENGSVVSEEYKMQFGNYITATSTKDPEKVNMWRRVLSFDYRKM